MRHTKLTTVLCTLTATVATAVLAGAAASHADVRSRAGTPPANHPTHFAGFPAVGIKASTPTTGTLVISRRPTASTEWNVYADGRIIWQKWTQSGDATVVPRGARRLETGYVQQRLTLQGVQLLQSKILATGLFEHDLGSLPTSVWADRQIRAFVPACYSIAFDRGYPDLSKLPPRAGKALSQYKQLRRHAYQVVTTRQARALLQAFVQAGISTQDNHARNIGFALGSLPGQHQPSYLHLSPALPDGCF